MSNVCNRACERPPQAPVMIVSSLVSLKLGTPVAIVVCVVGGCCVCVWGCAVQSSQTNSPKKHQALSPAGVGTGSLYTGRSEKICTGSRSLPSRRSPFPSRQKKQRRLQRQRPGTSPSPPLTTPVIYTCT